MNVFFMYSSYMISTGNADNGLKLDLLCLTVNETVSDNHRRKSRAFFFLVRTCAQRRVLKGIM